jgi:hypothetical protein
MNEEFPIRSKLAGHWPDMPGGLKVNDISFKSFQNIFPLFGEISNDDQNIFTQRLCETHSKRVLDDLNETYMYQ